MDKNGKSCPANIIVTSLNYWLIVGCLDRGYCAWYATNVLSNVLFKERKSKNKNVLSNVLFKERKCNFPIKKKERKQTWKKES